MCHSAIMISLLSTVPQCQIPEFRKSSYYSSARIALSLLLCQLLQHKQQLSLNAVNECLVYKQLFSYPGLWVKAAEIPRKQRFHWWKISAVWWLQWGVSKVLAQTSVSLLQGLCASQAGLPKWTASLGSGAVWMPQSKRAQAQSRIWGTFLVVLSTLF